MQIKATIEMTEEEKEVVRLIDSIRAAVLQANRAGVGRWNYLADGTTDAGVYKRLNDIEKEVVEELLGGVMSYDQIDRLRNMVLDNGESYEWNMENNLALVLG